MEWAGPVLRRPGPDDTGDEAEFSRAVLELIPTGRIGAVVRQRVVIQGRVQGVFFRDSIRQRADGLGVCGWASNRSDGAVEAVLEGDRDAVAEMLEFCRTGPPRARVERVEVSDEPPEGLKGFRIR